MIPTGAFFRFSLNGGAFCRDQPGERVGHRSRAFSLGLGANACSVTRVVSLRPHWAGRELIGKRRGTLDHRNWVLTSNGQPSLRGSVHSAARPLCRAPARVVGSRGPGCSAAPHLGWVKADNRRGPDKGGVGPVIARPPPRVASILCPSALCPQCGH